MTEPYPPRRVCECTHPKAEHVPELRPGYMACVSAGCDCADYRDEPPVPRQRMPLGRPGSAGLLSDPPGGPSTVLTPTQAIRAAQDRHPSGRPIGWRTDRHVLVAREQLEWLTADRRALAELRQGLATALGLTAVVPDAELLALLRVELEGDT